MAFKDYNKLLAEVEALNELDLQIKQKKSELAEIESLDEYNEHAQLINQLVDEYNERRALVKSKI